MTKIEMFEKFKNATLDYISTMIEIYESGVVNIWDDNIIEGTIAGMYEDLNTFGKFELVSIIAED